MRGIVCRNLRLKLVAGLGIALAAPAFAVSGATTTALTAQSAAAGSCPTTGLTLTLTTLSVAVTSASGVPAGTVTIMDGGGSSALQLASATLDGTGKASIVLYLPNGAHSLSAVYGGSASFAGSTSTAAAATISTQCDSAYAVTVSNLTPANTLTAGQSGEAQVVVVPSEAFVASLAGGPAFVALSCTGLPDQASCTFTPEDVEISPGQDAGVSSTMAILTNAASTTSISPASRPGRSSAPIAWALLLPGVLGLAWGVRRRDWLRRLSLVALVAGVAVLGMTGCNPRYNYEHHGPPANPATPAGTYTITVTGQSTNGVTAITNSTTFSLAVK